ncbi:MAG: hypothetical protein ICV51_17865 [Flavisolibacter sp.]|nr:hypothetical protein [Flavisolibacter sp.]
MAKSSAIKYPKDQTGNLNRVIYQLKNGKTPAFISLVKLNDNLFHLLTPDGKLMIRNGGWSYTLNRKEPFTNISADLPFFSAFTSLYSDTARQVIFEGRTPCLDFARQYNLKVSEDCIKLKWKLVLYKDPITFAPTTYTLYYTLSRSDTIKGKWAITKGVPSNPHVFIYQLNPDKRNEAISFLAGDENVLFFLDKNNLLLIGDSNFSYTLNKRKM